MSVEAQFIAPMVPNFISLRLPDGRVVKMSVGLLDSEQITEVSGLWVVAFRAHAEKKREELEDIRRENNR